MPERILKWRGKDPNGKGRGRGWYWHRGKGIYSRYTGVVDKSWIAKNPSINVRKKMDDRSYNNIQKKSPHIGDYSKSKKPAGFPSRTQKGRPMNKRPVGYY